MDVTLSNEQQQAKDTVRDFLEGEGGIELARRMIDGDESVVRELWDSLSDMDYPALSVPLEYNGLETGLVYQSAVLQEMGRVAMPGPFLETVVFSAPVISALGDESQKEELLPAIATGDLTLSFALYDTSENEVPAAITMEAARSGSMFELSGTKTHVPYAGMVDRVVVIARTARDEGYGGLSVFLVDPAVGEVTRVPSLDKTRPLYEVNFDGVSVPASTLLGSVNGAGDVIRAAVDRYNVGVSSWLVGAGDRVVDLSATYGNEREQYGHPIGRFQAVKHRIVDMWMNVERARSLVYYAAWAVDEGDSDAPRAVSAVKAFTSDTLHDAFADGIKNHGGMGFTADHDGHIYLKQAKAWRNYLGSPEYHRERVATARGF